MSSSNSHFVRRAYPCLEHQRAMISTDAILWVIVFASGV
jgi:hypothetical protein